MTPVGRRLRQQDLPPRGHHPQPAALPGMPEQPAVTREKEAKASHSLAQHPWAPISRLPWSPPEQSPESRGVGDSALLAHGTTPGARWKARGAAAGPEDRTARGSRPAAESGDLAAEGGLPVEEQGPEAEKGNPWWERKSRIGRAHAGGQARPGHTGWPHQPMAWEEMPSRTHPGQSECLIWSTVGTGPGWKLSFRSQGHARPGKSAGQVCWFHQHRAHAHLCYVHDRMPALRGENLFALWERMQARRRKLSPSLNSAASEEESRLRALDES